MTSLGKVLVSVVGLSLLTACGGGGGGSSDNSPTPTPTPPSEPTSSQIIANASEYDSAKIQTASMSLIGERYTGKSTEVPLDPLNSQQIFNYLFNDYRTEIPELELNGLPDIIGGSNSLTQNCYYGGSISYKGDLNSNSQGSVSLAFNNCQEFGWSPTLNGQAAIYIEQVSETASNMTLYFDNLNWQLDNNRFELTGYANFVENSSGNNYTVSVDQHVLFIIDNQEQLLLESTVSTSYENGKQSTSLDGDLYISDLGKVAFTLPDTHEFPPYLFDSVVELVGDKKAEFTFSQQAILYAEDSNGDGAVDVGTYFSSIDELLYGNAVDKQLVALDALSFPPVVSSPVRNSWNVDTTTTIEVSEGYITDTDTPIEALEVSYRWYINNEIVEGQTSNILPARIAVYGDEVTVTMIVSDGSNVVESLPTYFSLADSPVTVELINVPDSIEPNQQVKFQALVVDPDIGTIDQSTALISGPAGSSIDEDGNVSWNAPDAFLFSEQSYEFKFGLAGGETEHTVIVPIKVKSDKALPLARSGMEVPKLNNSMTVGDFDGDNLNEVLSTDSAHSIYLLAYQNGQYKQKWVYPYVLEGMGTIKQVIGVNLDNDSELEIFVVSEFGISVIDDLSSSARTLLSADYISFATLADIEGDGTLELAYLYKDSEYSNDTTVNVVSLNDVQTSLFSTSLDDAVQVEFANVDEDDSLEMISNNGLVYDTETWLNEWFSSQYFGDMGITAADFNDDGVDEIAGFDRWGNVSVYSAVDKAQLFSFDNFNTCTINHADVDGDDIHELLVGDCQWGNISSYDFINNELVVQSQVNMQGHGSVSLISGDADNDGEIELLWGTGISSSGGDGFIVADISDGTLSVDEEAIDFQLDQFSSAGWSQISQGEERAVFFVPKSSSGYDGSHIALFDADGDVEISEEISSNWDNSSIAVTTDFNNDGLGDIFLPNSHLYDGSFAAMQLLDNSIHWQIEGDYDSDIGVIRAKDMNADGFDDAVYVDGLSVKAIDIENQLLIATTTLDRYVVDLVPVTLGEKEALLVSSGDKLIMLTVNGSLFSEQSFVEQNCNRLELINFDDDADSELLCIVSNNTNSQLYIYEIDDLSITEKARHEVDYRIMDVIADPSKTEQQDVFLVVEGEEANGSWSYYSHYNVKKASREGDIIWSSPALIGTPTSHGLKARKSANGGVELLISTSSMMYWIK